MGSHSQIENIDRPQYSYISETLKKKTIMQSTFVIFASILAMASASAIKIEKPDGRLFLDTTINSNNFLALNGTVLTLAVVGLLLLAAAVLFASGSFSPAKIAQRYGSEYDQFYQTAEDAFSQTRYRRSAGNDIASKMAQLEQAFKKYQVTEAECEMYIACGASQVNRHEENGPLAKIIFDIISTFNRAKDRHKWDDRMEGLVQAFEYGTGAQAAGQVDACEPLRNKCFELHASTKY